LPDVPIGFVEEVLVLDLVFHANHLPQSLLNLAFAGLCALPAGEPNQADDLINVRHDVLHHDRCFAILDFLKQFGQRCFGFVLLVFRLIPTGGSRLMSAQGLWETGLLKNWFVIFI
jgi:hypothetical protein